VYYQGALPWSELDKMTTRQMLFYYRIMERQQAEQTVVDSFRYPEGGGKSKPIPPPKKLRELVNKKIEEWNAERKK